MTTMHTRLSESRKTQVHILKNIPALSFTGCVFPSSTLSYFEAVPTFRHSPHSPSSEFTLTKATRISASTDSPRSSAEVKNLGISGAISQLPTCMPSWVGQRQLFLLPFLRFPRLLLLNRENQSYTQDNEL
jgi:hypothetical protein